MLRVKREPVQSAAMATGSAIHFDCQAAISPARIIALALSSSPLLAIQAMITETRNATSMSTPLAAVMTAGL